MSRQKAMILSAVNISTAVIYAVDETLTVSNNKYSTELN